MQEKCNSSASFYIPSQQAFKCTTISHEKENIA
uniref:Uncharacterized protein n=1 Tax=Rhizophora mucronata TaxID=61149 RepID=A0A2P2QKR4_RHIMU